MAKHDHKVCTHENVKYCKTCALVHCTDCDKEWGGTTYQYYPYYGHPYTIYNGGGGQDSYKPRFVAASGSDAQGNQALGQKSADYVHTSTTGCSHGDHS